jgi:predicted RNA-binding Zn ribbon-like protein
MFISVKKGKKFAYFGIFTPVSINVVVNPEGEVVEENVAIREGLENALIMCRKALNTKRFQAYPDFIRELQEYEAELIDMLNGNDLDRVKLGFI